MPDVGESDAQLGQAGLEAVEGRGGARVYDRRLRTVDPIGRDHATKTEVNDVDRRNGHGCGVAAEGGGSLALFHGNEVALCAPQEDLPRTCDALFLVFQELFPLRQPPDCPRNREEHGEHLHRKTQRLVDEA